jgi:hypothetical protein
VAAATFAGIVAGAVPGLVFWFAVRRADGSYPPNSEAIVLLAVPLVAGTAFAAVCPPRVWRKSVVFTGLFGVPLAVFTYLAIYRNDPSGLFSGPMLAVGAWILCWERAMSPGCARGALVGGPSPSGRVDGGGGDTATTTGNCSKRGN